LPIDKFVGRLRKSAVRGFAHGEQVTASVVESAVSLVSEMPVVGNSVPAGSQFGLLNPIVSL
jgi:hypothetical protein